MKVKILILSSLLLLAFFVVNGFSVDWTNPGSQTTDQMLSGSEIGATNTLPGNYANPAAARNAESSQKGKGILNVSIGGKLNTFGNNPKETRDQDSSQTSPVENVTANTTAPAPTQAPTVTEPTSVSGSWSLEFTDSASHNAVITLFQSGDAVFGTGNMNLDANTTMVAAASGTLTGNELNLDLVTLGKVGLYRLMLMVSADSAAATGNYTTYSPSASPSTGSVKGTRSVTSS
jgi:hypothetical protein